MLLEVAVRRERLAAQVAGVAPPVLAGSLQVALQVVAAGKHLAAVGAGDERLPGVLPQVSPQRRPLVEGPVARPAGERLLARVDPEVDLEVPGARDADPAQRARGRFARLPRPSSRSDLPGSGFTLLAASFPRAALSSCCARGTPLGHFRSRDAFSGSGLTETSAGRKAGFRPERRVAFRFALVAEATRVLLALLLLLLLEVDWQEVHQVLLLALLLPVDPLPEALRQLFSAATNSRLGCGEGLQQNGR